ncbi:MAG: cation transporter [Chloroflexi bacterium]|nr:cation transporter [Chloroflexota bacterium]
MMTHHHEQVTAARLRTAFALTAVILIAEAIGGLASGSLALLADAGHVITDLVALGMAWFAAVQSLRPADARRTFGYHRTGILVALANAVALVVIAILILVEAYHRFYEVSPVNGLLMLLVAAFGLVVNVGVAFDLARAGRDNLNVKSALLHVIGDAAASAGVLAAGVAIAATGIVALDPIVSAVISVLICLGAWRIIGQALGILMEGVPAGVNVAEMVRQILRVPGVKDVHDLHVWSISNEMTALSCHVLMDDLRTSEVAGTLDTMRHLLRDRFGVSHSTIEVECDGCVTDNAFCSMSDDRDAAGHASIGATHGH